MSQTDILRVLEGNDGIERNLLFNKVNHLFGKVSFNVGLRKLVKQEEVIIVKRFNRVEGVRIKTEKLFICNF